MDEKKTGLKNIVLSRPMTVYPAKAVWTIPTRVGMVDSICILLFREPLREVLHAASNR